MIDLQTTLLARTYRNRHHDHLSKQIEHKQDKKQLLDFGSSERKPSQLSLLKLQAAIEGFAHYWDPLPTFWRCRKRRRGARKLPCLTVPLPR